MSNTIVVRYRTRPDAADENSRLIEAVFRSLGELAPEDFSYTAHRLADGVSFLHVASVGESGNPLTGLPAFVAFQRELPDRCAEQPAVIGATSVGSYVRP